ncbi:MAG: 2-amino-4-hydroxy-6-hydroxymethyldihydropteridine diphosphokinase [Chitinophagales bacterium]|nr:2-amino-4-hydroxy-6-hydroxymethyldihydropteridine diphosphokinase [Chitinophagales bacterium]
MNKPLYHLSIGSNLDDRLSQINHAKRLISSELGTIIAESKIYETQPWGFDDQPWFLNQVIAVASTIEAEGALNKIKHIETETGRQPGEKWQARHIDIDILLHGEEVINTEALTIPHAHFHERNFALIPLMEIASQSVHPVLHQTVEELYLECRDTGEVYIFNADE